MGGAEKSSPELRSGEGDQPQAGGGAGSVPTSLHHASHGPPPLQSQARTLPIGAQPVPQTAFLASPADIAIYGGAAGGGKRWALLLEPLRHVHRPDFGAVFFRRTGVQIRNEGGLWDESAKLYPHLGARPREQALEWRFPGGASVSFEIGRAHV